MSDPRKPLGATIRKLRETKGYTQEELAEAAGLHVTYVSGIERGVQNASIMKLSGIASSLGVKLRDLFHDL